MIQGHKGQVKICMESAKHRSSFRFFGLMNKVEGKTTDTNEQMNHIGLFSYLD